jgi:hypothetical protein
LRAEFALAGLDWRSWSAADRAAVTFLMLKRQHGDDPVALRALYVMVDDTEAVAEMDRQKMSQPAQVAVQTVGVRRG